MRDSGHGDWLIRCWGGKEEEEVGTNSGFYIVMAWIMELPIGLSTVDVWRCNYHLRSSGAERIQGARIMDTVSISDLQD